MLASPARADIPSDAIRYGYDADGRLTSVLTPASRTPGGQGSGTVGATYRWDAVGNLLSVGRVDASQTALVDVAPWHGNPGDTVALRGTGFSATASEDTVRLNGTIATVAAASASELSVVVPPGATSGPVTVATPNGSATGPQDFVVGTPGGPHVSGLSPVLTQAGGQVTISGDHFDPQTINDGVRINQTAAQITSASEASMQITVANATGAGPVKISTPVGATVGPDLYVVPPGFSTSTIADTARLHFGQATLATIPVAGKVGMYLYDGHAGQHVAFSLDNSTLGCKNVSWHNTDGSQLKSWVGTCGSFLDPVTLPSDGTYALVIYNSGAGSANLTPIDVPEDVSGTVTPTDAGGSVDLTTTTPGQNAWVRFTGSAGQRIAFSTPSVSANTSGSGSFGGSMWLYKPDGTYQQTLTSFATGGVGWTDAVTLPVSGTYSVLLDGSYATTGSVRFIAYDVHDVTGSLTPTPQGEQRSPSLAYPGERAVYSVDLTAGQRVSVAASGASGPMTAGWDLRWLKPDGSMLAYSGNWTSGGFFDQVTAPAAGTYKLVVTPNSGRTGSVNLTVYDASDQTRTISPSETGDSADLSFGTPGQNARLTFAGSAGQRVSLRVTNTTINNGYVTIYKPDGSILSGGQASFTSSSGGWLDPVVLPTAGTYTVLIDPYWSYTGSLRLTAYTFADVTGLLTPSLAGDTRTPSLATPGQRALYDVNLAAGQRLAVVTTGSTIANVTQYGSGYSLVWYKPDGSSLATSPAMYTGGGFFDQVVAPTSGTYKLVVDPSAWATGSTTLTAYDVPDVTGSVTPSTSGDSVDLNLAAPGQNARVTFAGTSGRQVSLRESNTSLCPRMTIYKPDGSLLVTGSSSCPGGLSLGPTTLPVTGTYTVLVDPPGTGTGAARLTAYDGNFPPGLRTPPPAGVGHAAPTGTLGGPWQPYPPRRAGGPGRGVGGGPPARDTVVRARAPYRTLRAYLRRPQAARGRSSLSAGARRRQTGSPAPGRVSRARPTHAPSLAGRRGQSRRSAPAPARYRSLREYLHPTYKTPRRGNAGSRRRRPALKRALVRRMRAEGRLAPAAWRPEPRHAWRVNRPSSEFRRLGALAGPPGITALAGQSLKLSGLPLAGARVAIKGTRATARTDATGRFLLLGVPAGRRVLVIDDPATRAHLTRYGRFEAQVYVKPGRTTVVPFTLWMTPLDPDGDRAIGSPTTRPTVVTNKRIPGFEVHIPAGSRVTDAAGRPVHRLNLTAIPTDRPPFPLPALVGVPVYFTVQPGGAYLSKGARIVYPNWGRLGAGQRVEFWNYDADGRGWYVYGRGTVSRDGRQLVPDPGVRVWELTGAMVTILPGAPLLAAIVGGALDDGDPVDVGSGLFVYRKTDLAVNDTMPAALTRTYRPADSNCYMFGRGTTGPYDSRMQIGSGQATGAFILPDGGQVAFARTSAPDATPAVYEARTNPGRFFGSVAHTSANGGDLRLRDGTTFSLTYYGGISRITDRFGDAQQISWSNPRQSRPIQVTTPNGRWIKFNYGTAGSCYAVTSATDNAGRTVSYGYDSGGRLTSVTDPNGGVTTYAYNAADQMTSITDPRHITYLTNTYDGHGRVATQTMADGGTYTFAYTTDATNHITTTRVTDPRGTARKVDFDTAGFPTSDTADYGGPTQQQTTYQRLIGSNLVSSATDPLGRTTGLDYDANGNLTQETRLAGTPGAVSSQWAYDPTFSQPTSSTDPLGHTTTYAYDSSGRLTGVQDPTGRQTTVGYTGTSAQPTSTTDPGGHTTTLAYTGGDLTAIADPLGRTTTRYYDVIGRPLSVIGPSGDTTLTRWDGDDQVTRVTAPSGASTNFSYDGNGNPTTVTDARGNSTSATYDSMDRTASSTDALGHTSQFSHDLNGNLTQATDRNGLTTSYQYDALNRPTSITDDGTRTLSYDAANRPTQITDSSGTITNGYDPLGRLTSQSTPQGDIGYAYDADGRRVSMSTGGQADTAYSYDDASRLTGIARGDQGVSLAYDQTGRPSSVTLPDGIAQTYAYDAASQLTQIAYQHSGTALGELDYAYDSAGRRTAVWGDSARTGLPDPLSSANYDAANRLTARNGQSFSYDNNGNLTDDGATTYQWDGRGQLTTLSSAGTSASFSYDALGRRTSRTVNGQTTAFRYDGANPIREQTGDATATLLSGLGLDENYARTDANGTSSYLTDALGSTTALADGGGTVRTTYTYDPFGAPVAAGDPSGNTHQFTGRENDGTGLDYLRARYYSPTQARFISQDPTGLAGSGPNLYAYTAGNPISLTDPTGTSPIDDLVNFECSWSDAFTAGGTKADRKAYFGQDGCDSSSDAGQAGTAAGLLTGFGVPGLGEADAARVGLMGAEEATNAARTAGNAASDTVVLGHYPEYVQSAEEVGGRTFNVPKRAWDAMTPEQQWAANQRFLDRAIARGSEIRLATPAEAAREGSFYERELQYLESKGYRVGPDGRTMVPPGR